MITFAQLFLLSWSIYGIYSSISCKNENNKDVDWFIILKIPASSNYFYLSSESNSGKWNIPNYSLNDNKNFLAVTLRQMYDSERNNAFFALYNDEKPLDRFSAEKSRGGHLKGVVNFDRNSGFWLVHSVPRFPDQYKYEYTNGESINGQSFFCVTLGIQYLKSIASQLLIMYADVYAYNFPTNFSNDDDLMSTLYQLVLNQHSPGKRSQRIDLATINGVKLSHFGKSNEDHKDLYLDIIAPQLNVSLFVECWMEGTDKMPSNCQNFNKIYNVRRVSIEGITYSEEVDHSKWAVSAPTSSPVVCIGDINRMDTQMYRGGGSLCVFETTIWKLFSPIVRDYEPCSKLNFVL